MTPGSRATTPSITVEQTAAALQAAEAAAGPGGGPSASLGGTLENHPAYVSWEEKKEPSERKPARKASGHSYTVKFYLVDTHGIEYLAATGAPGFAVGWETVGKWGRGDCWRLWRLRDCLPFTHS